MDQFEANSQKDGHMLQLAHIPGDVLLCLAQKLSLSTLVLLSMTATEWRKFVDVKCRRIMIQGIRKEISDFSFHSFHDLFRRPHPEMILLSENADSMYTGTVYVSGRTMIHGTFLRFHDFEDIEIPLRIKCRVRVGDSPQQLNVAQTPRKIITFSGFKLTAALRSEKQARTSSLRVPTRTYDMYLESVHCVQIDPRGPNEESEKSKSKLRLLMRGVVVQEGLTLRGYYANVQQVCRMCRRNRWVYVTFQETDDPGWQRICGSCRRDFFVNIGQLRRVYNFSFDENNFRKKTNNIRRGYLANFGRSNNEHHLMNKEQAAQSAGFSSWVSMVTARDRKLWS